MKKLSVLLFMIIGLMADFSSAYAQDQDPVLFRINGKGIHQSEFEEVYRRNNVEMDVADPRPVEEYLDLFINFKLKVLEAMSLGMDTNAAFIKELEGYREQLARPYFYDQQVSDQLLREAYDRMQYDLRASHILVAVDEYAPAEDTLKAFERIMNIYNRIQDGEPFANVARAESDDPSARDRQATAQQPAFRGNSGDLGYFTVLNMVYPFESAAYNTAVGEVSQPVRSPFGYHIIRVTDRLPAMGRVQAAHIMVNSPLGTSSVDEEKSVQKINELYQRLLQGEDFGALATEFSDDGASARRNGQLPEFTCNRMVPEFIKAIHELKEPGDFSPPIKTDFGWHIVKLIEKKQPGSFEEEYYELKNRLSRDSRSEISREVVLKRLKEEYDFQEYPERLEVFFNLVDSSIFEGKWDASAASDLREEMISFAGQSYTQQHFANYLDQVQGVRTPEEVMPYVLTIYHDWVEGLLIDYEDSRLEDKYPDFRNIMKEYHDGILLFELTDKMVWSRAIEDSTGLEAFYEDQKENYMWGDRLHATVFLCKDEKTARQTRKMARRFMDKETGEGYQHVLDAMNAVSQTDVSAKQGKFEQEQDPVIDQVEWKSGLGRPFAWNDRVALVYVHEVLEAQPKQIDEIRGLLIADYQNYLEKAWVDRLRTKYQVEINDEVINRIIN
ncbi:MAG: peptidylprolyl isomerase [Bacteroidales bacterium]